MQTKRKKRFHCQLCSKTFEFTWQVAQHYRHKHPNRVSPSNHKGLTNGDGDSAHEAETFLHEHTIYALGYLQAWLTDYATSNGLPAALLTERVARFLLHPSHRPVLGSAYRLPQVRGGSTKRTEVRTP